VPPHAQQSSLRHASGGQDASSLPDVHGTGLLPLPLGTQGLANQQYATAPVPSFVSPSMWQESVASVYEGGLKRQWDYDSSNNVMNQAMKRR